MKRLPFPHAGRYTQSGSERLERWSPWRLMHRCMDGWIDVLVNTQRESGLGSGIGGEHVLALHHFVRLVLQLIGLTT